MLQLRHPGNGVAFLWLCIYNLTMKIIVGFGNPGHQYNFTRHNFGFLALDFYAKVYGFEFKPQPKFKAEIAKVDDVLFVKPQTFYNDIGISIRAICDFYKAHPQDILAVCDDFNLPFGQIRFRERGSAGGNNGLKSAITHLGTEDFPRLRLGTGNDPLKNRIGDVDFVLSKFTPEEHEQLPQILREIADFVAKY